MKWQQPSHCLTVALSMLALLHAFGASAGTAQDVRPSPIELQEIWDFQIMVDGIEVSLPSPSFPDGMDADQQEAKLMEVAGKYPLDRFLRNSIVAPLALKRESIKNGAGERVGHRADLWFIAHGSIDAIRSKDLFSTMVDAEQSDEGDSGEALPPEELAERGLSITKREGEKQGFYRFHVGVIDRVLVEGVVFGSTRSSKDSHFAAAIIDERFRGDANYPNQWRHSDADAEDSQPYGGLAGYAKATRLQRHGDAILVECHLIVHEPTTWFNGPNLLSSKLPLFTQDAVRKFRRLLAK